MKKTIQNTQCMVYFTYISHKQISKCSYINIPAGGWTNPSEQKTSQIGSYHFPQVWVKINKYLKPPSVIYIYHTLSVWKWFIQETLAEHPRHWWFLRWQLPHLWVPKMSNNRPGKYLEDGLPGIYLHVPPSTHFWKTRVSHDFRIPFTNQPGFHSFRGGSSQDL